MFAVFVSNDSEHAPPRHLQEKPITSLVWQLTTKIITLLSSNQLNK